MLGQGGQMPQSQQTSQSYLQSTNVEKPRERAPEKRNWWIQSSSETDYPLSLSMRAACGLVMGKIRAAFAKPAVHFALFVSHSISWRGGTRVGKESTFLAVGHNLVKGRYEIMGGLRAGLIAGRTHSRHPWRQRYHIPPKRSYPPTILHSTRSSPSNPKDAYELSKRAWCSTFHTPRMVHGI
jgi:hypothetical protein